MAAIGNEYKWVYSLVHFTDKATIAEIIGITNPGLILSTGGLVKDSDHTRKED